MRRMPGVLLALALVASVWPTGAGAWQTPDPTSPMLQDVPVSASGSGGSMATALATLTPLTEPGTHGDASVLQDGSTTTLVVRLSDLASGTLHAGHIRLGGCDGPSLFALPDILPDRTGRGSASASLPAPLAPDGWWITYQAVGTLASPNPACGLLRVGSTAGEPIQDTERCPLRAAPVRSGCQ